MKKIIVGLITASLLLPAAAFAGAVVVEGDEAKTLYAAEKANFRTLVQKDKKFILRSPDGAEDPRVKKMTVKVGEKVFITNEEAEYVHNVYDKTDDSWVLKKQHPSEVAIISFDAPGVHKLKCAIHPKMKIKITVE